MKSRIEGRRDHEIGVCALIATILCKTALSRWRMPDDDIIKISARVDPDFIGEHAYGRSVLDVLDVKSIRFERCQ